MELLESVASALVRHLRGILAVDESIATMSARLAAAGVAFLSGGQRPERATENLAAMQRRPHIWPLTFSFGRALVDPALAAWRGEPQGGQRASGPWPGGSR